VSSNSSVRAQDFLTEDPMVLPWGKLVKLLRGQTGLLLAVVLGTVLKITKALGGGSAINAGARQSHPVSYSQIPILGKKAFESLRSQIPDFEFISYATRTMIGLRQEYSALALHYDQRTIAICQWQHHMLVLPADKISDEREKNTESLTTDFVSFEGEFPIVTSYLPREHMGAADLFDESLGDIVVRSNDARIETVLAEHLSRIERRRVDLLTPESAAHSSKKYGERVRDHFIDLGLLRPITEKELVKILAQQDRHATRFAKYTVVESGNPLLPY